jgi:dolichol-phosphate hexosyltransferase
MPRSAIRSPSTDRARRPALPSPPFTVVVPALNEQETIGAVLRAVRGLTDDLIVVDGRSRDGTADIARALGARVVEDAGRGKGDAVRTGLDAARHPIVVFIDADGSHEPLDIPKLVAPIAAGEADLVIGSRMLGGSEELFGSIPEAIRMAGSVMISLTINYRYGVRLTDYQNGFRAIRTDVGRALRLRSVRTTIEQEMAMRCLQEGYRVAECASHEYRRRGGRSKVDVLRWSPVYVWSVIRGIAGRRRPARLPVPLPATAAAFGAPSAAKVFTTTEPTLVPAAARPAAPTRPRA